MRTVVARSTTADVAPTVGGGDGPPRSIRGWKEGRCAFARLGDGVPLVVVVLPQRALELARRVEQALTCVRGVACARANKGWFVREPLRLISEGPRGRRRPTTRAPHVSSPPCFFLRVAGGPFAARRTQPRVPARAGRAHAVRACEPPCPRPPSHLVAEGGTPGRGSRGRARFGLSTGGRRWTARAPRATTRLGRGARVRRAATTGPAARCARKGGGETWGRASR